MNRLEINKLSTESFDVVIVGGGINGSATAQQLAANGFRILLIDKGDFAQGATSKSSRILHCGLRHLTPGKSAWDFLFSPSTFLIACNNVYKSMQARTQVAHTMKELVRPFKFCFPIYKNGPYSPWQVDIAFLLLKILGPKEPPLDYIRYNKKNMEQVPFARWMRDQDKLSGFAVFRDYQFLSAERLVIDTLIDSDRLGGIVRNYTQCHNAKRIGDMWELALSDTITKEKATVKTKLVINTAGPWGDLLNHKLTGDKHPRTVGLKGIHIIARLPEELAGQGMMTITRNHETIYCLPWHGLHYIGPTRTPYKDNLDDLNANDQEIQWVLDEINHAMPKIALTQSQIFYSWAGIQPLTFDASDSKGSRQVKIHDLSDIGSPNMLMLTGGPIITYRIIAKKMLKEVLKRIRPTAAKASVCYHASEMSCKMFQGENSESVAHISEELFKTIAKEEQIVSLSDLYLRRTELGWNQDQGLDSIETNTKIIAEILGWHKEEIQRQILNYKNKSGIFYGGL